MQIIYGAPKTQYAIQDNSSIMAVTSAGTTGTAAEPQLTGHKDIIFETEDPIILKNGEGILLHHNNNLAGNTNHQIKLYIEWKEQDNTTAAPTKENDYIAEVGPAFGATTSGYVYSTFFNPSDSGKNYTIKRIDVKGDRVTTVTSPSPTLAVIPITAASGGNILTNLNFTKKDSTSADPTAEIRYQGVTATLTAPTESKIASIIQPTVRGQDYGRTTINQIIGDEQIIQPGEGIALVQESVAGDVGMRYYIAITWNETAPSSPAGNNPPSNVTLLAPERANNTLLNRTVTFQWYNATDADNDPISYRLVVDDISAFTSPAINVSVPAQAGSNNVTYYSTTELSLDTAYFWKIIANDTTTNGTDSEVRNFTIPSTVTISLPTATIDFGSPGLGDTINTTNPSYPPIAVRNEGNTLIDINLSIFRNLWVSKPSPTNNLMYRIDNFTGQEGAFNWSGSVTTYTAIPIVNNTAIKQLNYTIKNTANMHIEITVPTDEPAGNKSALLLITGWASA